MSGIITIEPMSFATSMQSAVRAGLKTSTCRAVDSNNTRLSRGKFEDIRDLRAEGIAGTDALRVHQYWQGRKHLCTLRPKVDPHTLVWMRGKDGKGRDTGPSLYIDQVSVLRLQELQIVHFEALGLYWYSDTPRLPANAQDWRAIAERILSMEGGRNSAALRKSLPVLPTPRDCYGLLWDALYGPGSWSANPWIWLYSFKVLRHPAATALEMARSGVLHYELSQP